jgi:hypothetical protein
MPPLQPVDGVVKCTVNGIAGGRPTANLFYIVHGTSAAWTAAQVQAAADLINAQYAAHFLPLLTSAFALTGTDAVDLSSSAGAAASHPSGATGGASGAFFPNNVAACISWLTARHYRGGHARTYLPGIPAAASVDGVHWTSTFLGSMGSAALDFRAAVNAASSGLPAPISLVSVTRVIGGVVRVPATFDVITGSRFDDRVDTQRRRLGR